MGQVNPSRFQQVKDLPENYEGEEAQSLAQLHGIANNVKAFRRK